MANGRRSLLRDDQSQLVALALAFDVLSLAGHGLGFLRKPFAGVLHAVFDLGTISSMGGAHHDRFSDPIGPRTESHLFFHVHDGLRVDAVFCAGLRVAKQMHAGGAEGFQPRGELFGVFIQNAR